MPKNGGVGFHDERRPSPVTDLGGSEIEHTLTKASRGTAETATPYEVREQTCPVNG